MSSSISTSLLTHGCHAPEQWPDAHKWLENLAYGLRNNKWELEEAGANNVMCGAWGDMAWKQ